VFFMSEIRISQLTKNIKRQLCSSLPDQYYNQASRKTSVKNYAALGQEACPTMPCGCGLRTMPK
jgi:hypothetical protein